MQHLFLLMDITLEKLLRHPLLNTLSEDEIAELRPRVRLRQARMGETIFQQGDEAEFFYLVASGELEVLMATDGGKQESVNLLYPGDFFGDVSFIIEQPRGVTVRVIQEGDLLYMTGEEMLRLRDEIPGFAERLTQLGERIETRSVLSFDGQQEGEVVLHLSRLHWVALVHQLLPTVGFALVWLFVTLFIAFLVRADTDAWERTFIWSIPGFLVLLIYAFWKYLDWWMDLYIFTNRRVIVVERTVGFMARRLETSLTKIQSVRVDTPNPVEAWLGYSDMLISTAAQGVQSTMKLDYLQDADTIASQILVELNRVQKNMVNEDREAKRRALLNAIGEDPAPESPATPADPSLPPAPEPLPTWVNYFYPQVREQRGTTIIWRKHPIILISESWPAWISFIATVYLVLAIPNWIELSITGGVVWTTISVLWTSLMVFWIWWRYDDWRNDRYVLTEDTLIDEDIKPLGFNRDVRRASLDSIQDIRYEQTNPLDLLFNVGKVLIQTAGQQGQFTFDWVSNPGEVQADINRYVQIRKEARERQEAEGFRQEVLDLINIYDEHRRGRGPQSSRPAPIPTPTPINPDDPDATRRSDIL
jgi:uncharacterized membrane protein YdbT with pleckstrin-like domain